MSNPPLDPQDLIAKAEAALAALSDQFTPWLEGELAKLEAARAALDLDPLDVQALDSLNHRAHDLKGLGTTCQFESITRLAASLCRLVAAHTPGQPPRLDLIDAHIQGIKTALSENLGNADQDPARTMIEALERAVEDLGLP
jgi:chemotaxis protein histidine kinase CheA